MFNCKRPRPRTLAPEQGGGDDKVLRRVNLPNFRDGHYGMVNFLQEHDKKFKVGDWYASSYFSKTEGNLQKGFVKLIKNSKENDAEDDDVPKADTFVWKWFPIDD